MNKHANHPAGEQTGQRNYERREDRKEVDGRRTAPRAEGGDDEEE